MDRKVRAEQAESKALREPDWDRLDAFAYILHLAVGHREAHTASDCVVSIFSMLQASGWINNEESEL